MPVFCYTKIMKEKPRKHPKNNREEKPKDIKGNRFTRFVKKHKISIIAVVSSLFLALGIIVAAYWPKGEIDLGIPKEGKPKKVTKQEEPKYEMPLSGVKVTNENLTKRRPFAVSIENSPEARPQSSLNMADIVYETVAEGGITRFLAFYQQNEPNEIGPVRSARTYFLDWVMPYDAVFVHAGGSEAALNLIRSLGIKEIDDLKGDKAFWRDNSRYAPHNDYTNYSKIKNVALKKGFDLDYNVAGYSFKDDLKKEERLEAQTINVSFSSASYNVSWQYNKERNLYNRLIAGTPHLDRVTDKQIMAKNIVVQEVLQFPSSTAEQHSKKTVGSGNATIFLDGQAVKAIWKKADRKSPTRFYDAAGNEIKFNRGQTWFEVITQFGSVKAG
ncbi:MAG: hypothetical protein UU65_C0002G0032 [candidate division CPR2 bacterium GW2011_GWC1_41_48]|uniref:PT repeat-containing protein n=1 Tax=candidate division CPR2 bacterium GW2011_GWC1_41_48 TaxID=1618344 RepID=A0A0G0W8E1_UNCC2|nr:MAG: hypothetical protein UT47_C0002G0272 [candidate division CPR2 bacterium GW2011_GWC2_39_35]KKS09254.1 MAG: hypothetical protein UU65_C0002G0032 [candidate division CPR2 bacterium GW2011_GWC1_41_48]